MNPHPHQLLADAKASDDLPTCAACTGVWKAYVAKMLNLSSPAGTDVILPTSHSALPAPKHPKKGHLNCLSGSFSRGSK